jgi:nicotinamide mononucleotide adenylyltransferase
VPQILNRTFGGIKVHLFNVIDSGKQPLVIIACGSFSPVTYLHLRMFEMAWDRVQFDSPRYYLIGGYFSPTSDAYGKAGLAPGHHRIHMCQLATAASHWIMVDDWEVKQKDDWQRTVFVLDHFHHHLNSLPQRLDPSRPTIRIMLLAGGDLIESFGTPGLWAREDVNIRKIYRACAFLFVILQIYWMILVGSYCWTIWLLYRRKNRC